MIYFLDEDILLEDFSCEGTELFPVFQTAKFAIRLIQIAVPFALIIWGSLDWFKALIAHDEKEMRIKRKPFIARVIAAMIVLILPMLLQKISEGLAGTNEFWTCYSEAKPRLNFKGMEIEGWDKGESSPDLPNNNYEIIGGGESITNEMNNISDEISEEIDSIESKANEAKEAVQKYCSEYAVDECKTTDFYGYKCHVSVDGTKCVPLEEYRSSKSRCWHAGSF